MVIKDTPTALDYLILHHISQAFIKSISLISKGDAGALTREIYEEAVVYLVKFTQDYTTSEQSLSRESQEVLRLIERSTKIRSPILDESRPNMKFH